MELKPSEIAEALYENHSVTKMEVHTLRKGEAKLTELPQELNFYSQKKCKLLFITN